MSTNPEVDTAPTAGSAAGKYHFNRMVTHIIVSNGTGQTINVKIGRGTASVSNYDYIILNGEFAIIDKNFPAYQPYLSVWIPASGTAANLSIKGV